MLSIDEDIKTNTFHNYFLTERNALIWMTQKNIPYKEISRQLVDKENVNIGLYGR